MNKPVRRIVCIDKPDWTSMAIADGPCPVRTDPARPGYSSTRIWVTDRTPARIKDVRETLDTPDTLEPPPGGSVCRVVTFPPDDGFIPSMQKTRTLDFCLILEGEITLVLDTQEVHLKAGDTVVQRGTNHTWSNRSSRPCTVAFSSHDGKF
jgi:mannose-6-phosphate isomerase-like protein (cupin superfamily)